MIKKILQKDEKVLHKIAKEILLAEIKTSKTKNKIKKIIKDMSDSLNSQSDGVAIAAPQIGYSLRIFVVSGKIFEKEFVSNQTDKIPNKKPINDAKNNKRTIKDLVFINPVISKLSREKQWLPEGCLCTPTLW